MIAAVLAYGVSSVATQPLDDDSRERMIGCVRVLTTRNPALATVWLQSCRTSFASMLQEKQYQDAADDRAREAEQLQQPDELIDFIHLKNKRGLSALEIDDEITSDLQRATGMVRSSDWVLIRINYILWCKHL